MSLDKDIHDALNHALSQKGKRPFSDSEAQKLFAAVNQYRGIAYTLASSPHPFCKDAVKNTDSIQLIYPCDTVQLRCILENEKIGLDGGLTALFSESFADKYLRHYPLFLTVARNKLQRCELKTGSVFVFDESIDIGDAMYRLISKDPVGSDSIIHARRILKSTEARIDFAVDSGVPGIATPRQVEAMKKIAQANNTNIALNEMENNIFSFLRQAKSQVAPNVELRVAGGWVRDKLLGQPSDDIDIAISGMSGYEFAQLIEQYASQNGVAGVGQAYDVSLDKDAEPTPKEEKNTSLFVGGLPVFGLKIEFVPMRTEQYNEGSRKPEIVRTDNVEEDSQRRDLTINALYYNIDTMQVEDYVGGVRDLETMTLRTPNDPVQTFLEDPLRALRVLRFYSKYENSQIDESIVEALKDDRVQQAYRQKVAPERAGKEFRKMLGGKKPAEAVGMLFDTGFYATAFDIPEGYANIKMDQQNENHLLTLDEHTTSVIKNLNNLMLESGEDDEVRSLMNLAAMFHDFGKMDPDIRKPHPKKPGQMTYRGHEDVSADFVNKALKSIGIGSDERKFVEKVVGLHMRPHGYPENIKDKSIKKFLDEAKIKGMDQDEFDPKLKELYQRIPEFTYMHAIADSMSKGGDDADWEEDVATKRKHIDRINNFYQQQVSKPPLVSVLGTSVGQFAMSIFPDLDPKTGYIKEVTEKLDQAYALGQINNINDAENFVKGLGIESRYGQQTVDNKMSNWYLRTEKLADASSAAQPETMNTNPYEGTPIANLDDEIVRMKRKVVRRNDKGPVLERNELSDISKKHDKVRVPFVEGDRIRKRQRPLSEQAPTGIVKGFRNGKMLIHWDGKTDVDEIPLDQTVYLAEKIERY